MNGNRSLDILANGNENPDFNVGASGNLEIARNSNKSLEIAGNSSKSLEIAAEIGIVHIPSQNSISTVFLNICELKPNHVAA